MREDVLGDVVLALNDIAPWVLFPAALIGAVAALLGRKRLAWTAMAVAVLAIVVPTAFGVWWTLTLPPT